MATLSEIIGRVRRRVADYKDEVVYSDEYYVEAIEFGLSKLSHDFDATYSAVEDVPFKRVFLLTKLATIEMCFIRAAGYVDQDADSTGGGEATFHSIKVPDLEIEGEAPSADEAADTWLSLASRLQAEYDSEIEHVGGSSNAAGIQTGYLKRISLSTGGYRKYDLDEGPLAVTLSAVVTGSNVALSWSTLYHETFGAYEVWRDTDATFATEERIAYFPDNHDTTYTDSDRAAGTYYYRLKTVNMNQLKANSNTLTVTVT